MLRDGKNLKDSRSPLPSSLGPLTQTSPLANGEEQGGGLSYTKTDKLITALFMVTDILDKDEPLRNKLRTLGAGIISDMYSTPLDAPKKISEIMSFLDIATAINLISLMNCNILKKEFLELYRSVGGSAEPSKVVNRSVNLAEFFETPLLDEEGVGGGNSLITTSPFRHSSSERRRENPKGHHNSIGHQYSTRIGVQKAGTLMKVLSDTKLSNIVGNSFDILKKERREDIINVIKTINGNATITDIKKGAHGSLVSCSEKTLQRELVSMVKDGVLNKTGEKRWSRYFIKN